MFFLEHGPKNVSTTRGERKEHKREIDLRRLTIDAYVFLFSFPGHSRTQVPQRMDRMCAEVSAQGRRRSPQLSAPSWLSGTKWPTVLQRY